MSSLDKDGNLSEGLKTDGVMLNTSQCNFPDEWTEKGEPVSESEKHGDGRKESESLNKKSDISFFIERNKDGLKKTFIDRGNQSSHKESGKKNGMKRMREKMTASRKRMEYDKLREKAKSKIPKSINKLSTYVY